MTIKTLSYIHNLLVNDEQKASLKKKWMWDELCHAERDYDEGAISKERYLSFQEQYNEAKADYSRACDALREFEEKEW